MPSLSDTVKRLALMRARFASPQSEPEPSRLLEFFWRGSNPGSLKAKAYVPRGLGEGSPLVVVLHGCTQTAAGYDMGSGWSTLADHAGFALLYPEQQRSNNPNGCFNWFVPDDIRRDGGEALSIREMIEAFAAERRIDRQHIFITGLSAGGAMTSVMLATYPEIFAGGAIIAGLPFGVARTVPEALERMRGQGGPSTGELQKLLRGASSHAGAWPTLSVWHGDADRTVAAGNMDAIVAQWRVLHGVCEAPTRTDRIDGHTHRVWRDEAGNAVIETYSIAGMGHGTPLGVTATEGYGAAGPFMLEAGISSTLRIAQFWGIAEPGAVPAQPSADNSHDPGPEARLPGKEPNTQEPRRLRDVRTVENSTTRAAPEPPSKLGGAIEDALRAAGLMK